MNPPFGEVVVDDLLPMVAIHCCRSLDQFMSMDDRKTASDAATIVHHYTGFAIEHEEKLWKRSGYFSAGHAPSQKVTSIAQAKSIHWPAPAHLLQCKMLFTIK